MRLVLQFFALVLCSEDGGVVKILQKTAGEYKGKLHTGRVSTSSKSALPLQK
jgi:hypothetical protein